MATPERSNADVTVPDTQTHTEWCAFCKADVIPRGKGVCPRCARFLKHSFAARKHPVNKLRCQQILDALIADYRPLTTLSRAQVEQLAGVLEQLEVLRPGSQEHKRLVDLQQILGAALDASRSTTPQAHGSVINDDELIARVSSVLQQLLVVMPDRTATLLHGLLVRAGVALIVSLEDDGAVTIRD